MSMAVQTNYNFGFSKGVAGGLFDLSAHEVGTRQAEGAGICFGIGVVAGANKGTDVTLPTSATVSKDFEGVVVHNSVMVEKGMDHRVVIEEKRTVGCLRYGKIWIKIGKNAAPAYQEPIYFIIDGEEAGLFTTASDSDSVKVAVNGVFLGIVDDGIANAEFFPIQMKME